MSRLIQTLGVTLAGGILVHSVGVTSQRVCRELGIWISEGIVVEEQVHTPERYGGFVKLTTTREISLATTGVMLSSGSSES